VAENSNTAVEQSRRYGQMIARAWTDPAFKERLLAEPAAVAREQGIDIPEGVSLRAIEIAPAETYVVLTSPEPPFGAVAAEEQGPWASLLVRAASDPAYKEWLIAEPAQALAEHGMEPPAGTRVTVVEPSDTEGYLFVPPIPDGLEIEALDDDDTAGYAFCSGNTGGGCDCKASKLDAFYSVRSLSAQPRLISLIGSPIALQLWRL